jgi:hypothetical protein
MGDGFPCEARLRFLEWLRRPQPRASSPTRVCPQKIRGIAQRYSRSKFLFAYETDAKTLGCVPGRKPTLGHLVKATSYSGLLDC